MGLSGLGAVLAAIAVALCALPPPSPAAVKQVPSTSTPVASSPSCRYRTTNTTWQRCGIQAVLYCCSGGIHFERGDVNATSVRDPRGPTKNMTFVTTSDVASSFLVRRAQGCSGPAECLEVSVDFVGPVEVELSSLPADEALKVTVLDYARFQQWLVSTTTNDSAETQFLHNSSIRFDIKGSDAELVVYSPETAAAASAPPPPARFASACLSLTSTATRSNCSGCSPCSSPDTGNTRTLCLERPHSGTTVRLENVTGFWNGSYAYKHFWAVVGNACLKAEQLLPPVRSVDEQADPEPPAGENLATVVAGLGAVVALFLSAILYLGLKRRYSGDRQEAVSDEEVAIAIAQAEGPLQVVLLYKMEPGVREVAAQLRSMIGGTREVEVLDPYDDPRTIEQTAIAARNLLAHPNVVVIFFATEAAFSEDRERCNVYDIFFEAAKNQIESSQRDYYVGRILTIRWRWKHTVNQQTRNTVDSFSTNDRIPTFYAERVYFLPDRIERLLRDIPGAPTPDRMQENRLRETIEMYRTLRE